MFNLFLEVTDILDNKLNSLQDQVNSLETRFIKLEQGSIKNKINPTAPPPSPTPTAPPPSPTPTIKKDVPENPRRAVMNELRYLLEKRKQNTDNN
jgi:hypothetical protein